MYCAQIRKASRNHVCLVNVEAVDAVGECAVVVCYCIADGHINGVCILINTGVG